MQSTQADSLLIHGVQASRDRSPTLWKLRIWALLISMLAQNGPELAPVQKPV